MDLTDRLRYPSYLMMNSEMTEASSFEDLQHHSQRGILRWFLHHRNNPPGDEPDYTVSTVLGAAFHRGVAAMEKVYHIIHHIKKNQCGPALISLTHRRCMEPERPIYALYIATRDLDPYLKGLYRLDAFLEDIQQAIWNDLHGMSSPQELLNEIEEFARTPILFEQPREIKGELVYDWLSTMLEWLNWIKMI